MYGFQNLGYMSEDSLILFEDRLHLIERCSVSCRDFCATRFFLPVVLYLVRFMKWVYELGNAYLHFGKKHYLIEMKRYMFKRIVFLQRNATY